MDKEVMEVCLDSLCLSKGLSDDQKIREGANETFDLPDLGYGDGLTASKRLAKAMSDYFNEYVAFFSDVLAD